MKKKNNRPSLDLSFAYGTAIFKQLTQRDIDAIAESEHVSTGDTTIRSVTSLFVGRRRIAGLQEAILAASNDDDNDLTP